MNITPAKLAANRANARKSTGPRTAAGKFRSSLNAVRHGAFTQRLVLPSENVADFKAFRDAVNARLRPRSLDEHRLCEQIVDSTWRLLRLQRAMTGAYEGGSDLATIDRLSRYEQRLTRAIDRCLWNIVKFRGRKPTEARGPIATTVGRAESCDSGRDGQLCESQCESAIQSQADRDELPIGRGQT